MKKFSYVVDKGWVKIKNQATNSKQEPLLFFKYDRSKVFVCSELQPVKLKRYMYISWLNCYTMLAEDWLREEDVEFIL